VIKALDNCGVNSKLVWDYHQSLTILAEPNNAQFLWVPGHKEVEGNQYADQQAKRDLLHSFIGPEPI
jgi:ribonuclease HI